MNEKDFFLDVMFIFPHIFVSTKNFCSFKKVSMDVLSNNRELAQKIQEIGLSLNEFVSHMQSIEQQEAHAQTATVAS